MVKFSVSCIVMLFIGCMWFLGNVASVSAHEVTIHGYDPVSLQKGDWVSKIALAKTGHISNWKQCPVQNPITKKWYRVSEYNRLPVGAIVYVPIALEQSAVGAIDGALFSAYLKKHTRNEITIPPHSLSIAEQDIASEYYVNSEDIQELYARVIGMADSTIVMVGMVVLVTVLLIAIQRRLRDRAKLILLGRDIIDHLCDADTMLCRSELYTALRVSFFRKQIMIAGVLCTRDIQVLEEISMYSRFAVFGIALKTVRLHGHDMHIALEAKNIQEFKFNNKSKEDEIAFCAMAYEASTIFFKCFEDARKNTVYPQPMTKKITVDAVLHTATILITPAKGLHFPSLQYEKEDTLCVLDTACNVVLSKIGYEFVAHTPQDTKEGVLFSISFRFQNSQNLLVEKEIV